MSQAVQGPGFVTYAPAESRCVRCGFLIKETELADRNLESSGPGTSLKIVYRHTQFKDCKRS